MFRSLLYKRRRLCHPKGLVLTVFLLWILGSVFIFLQVVTKNGKVSIWQSMQRHSKDEISKSVQNFHKHAIVLDKQMEPVQQLIYQNLTKDVHKQMAVLNNQMEPVQQLIMQPMKKIIWAIPVFKCAWSLGVVLDSFITAGIVKQIVIFKNADSDNIDEVIRKYADQIQLQIVDNSHAWSRSPNKFPQKDQLLDRCYKEDTFNSRRSDLISCVKHYWWWMIQTAWSFTPDVICAMTDDMVLHSQTQNWIKQALSNLADTHLGLKLHDMQNVAAPWCIRAVDWVQIRAHKEEFRTHDDVRWDQTIAWMMDQNNITNKVLVPSVPLAKPISNCFSNQSANWDEKACTRYNKQLKEWASMPVSPLTKSSVWLNRKSEVTGGSGQAYCMAERNCPYLTWRPTDEKGVWRRYLTTPTKEDSFLVELNEVGLNMAKVKVTPGGENLTAVMGRRESDEFPTYSKGAWVLPFKPSFKTKLYQQRILDSAVVGRPTYCDTNFSGTTIVFERVEYANLYFTINDWYNMHTVFEHFGLSSARIMWLDGHAQGHFDNVWPVLFNAKVDRIGRYDGVLCFEHMIWMPKKSPIFHQFSVDGCTLNDFIWRVKRSYSVVPSDTKHDIIIERQPYKAHPRVSGRMDRVLTNMDAVRHKFPSAKVVRLEEMSFKEQLQLILNTKTLYGVHGAGLAFGLFLGPGSKIVEWVPASRASTLSFQQIASWRPDLFYERTPLKGEGDGKYSLPIEDTKKISKKQKSQNKNL